MDSLCLHCLEEYQWAEGLLDETCPECAQKGHTNTRKCDLCSREFFEKIDALKSQIDFRSELIELIKTHCVEKTEDKTICPMCLKANEPDFCKECVLALNSTLYELITKRRQRKGIK